MILLWLGSFALMLFGLEEAQKSFRQSIQMNFNFKNFFVRNLVGVSPQRSLYEAVVGLGYGGLAPRTALLRMSFDFLGAWWVFLLCGLLLSVQGLVFLGFGSLMFLNLLRFKKLNSVLRTIFATGLFLTGGEFLLRQSAILQSLLGESEVAFWLVDGRLPAVLSLLVTAVILSWFLRLQFWSLLLGLGLLMSSTISFNGALALLGGELLGQALLLLWRGRRLPEKNKSILQIWALASALGSLIGFFGAWCLKAFLGWGSSFGSDGLEQRSTELLILAAVLLLLQGFFQLVAGHFLTLKVTENVLVPAPVPSWWFESGLTSPQE